MTYLGAQSAFRELEPHEIDLVSGGDDPGESITVWGIPLYTGDGYDPTANNTGYAPDGFEGQGAGGVFAETTPGVQIFTHSQHCSTASGAVVQVANHVMGTGGFSQLHAADGSTYNGSTSGSSLLGIEFSALIVHKTDGSYGTWNDQIWTRDDVGQSFAPQAFPQNAIGYWHIHPNRGDDYQDAHDAYPSPGDWNVLQNLYDALHTIYPNADPSLWLTDPNGVTREFKLSERSYFAGLNLQQMGAMVGLAGRERTASCGS